MTTELEAARTLATGQIVAAAMNHAHAANLTAVVLEVRKALAIDIAAPAAPEPEELKPAVPIRKSVTPDAIICLEDGKAFKSLKRHLRTAYGMTPEDYRAKWSLPADYPMVAPNYSATRSQLAKDNGLGRKA